MTITNIQYTLDFDGSNNGIQATVNGQEIIVPLDPDNRHYVEIISATAEDNSIWGDAVPEPMALLQQNIYLLNS